MISHGISGVVFALSESHVIKKPIPGKREEEQIEIERQIYERLGPHPYITKYFGARVMQIDIGAGNLLLDQYGTAKLSDFAGSSLDKSMPLIAPSAHSEHPNMPYKKPTIQSKLFAVGSFLYEIETTKVPYADKNDGELERLFMTDIYPDTANLILGQVITKCWMAQYEDASEVVVDIQNIQSK
ncbi:hypothetical protein BKA61DRAFT_689210 [Leptodontidium sp. MPI-SDFR-AT-0119]|nr:hypothetical protein BKA61DRAFT_689210 [Leptodontidium sp. MPI-SDFR-AT-0119]